MAVTDFYEIDFLDVESDKSGDAIPLRYSVGGQTYIHVVDGGFQASGPGVAAHIRKYFGETAFIDNVVATHPDRDHSGGLRTILEEFNVGALWMHRPWLYAEDLLPRFARFTTVDGLTARLREIYSNIAALEEIAVRRGIPIFEAFQGAQIGAFRVMTPTKARYLDLVVESERTPESVEEAQATASDDWLKGLTKIIEAAVTFVKSAWGHEIFSPNETSAENEMSIVQYANLCGHRILLTGDTGRAGLTEAADYAPYVGLALPGVDKFQVPHHGGRRNVSTEVLDRWLGQRWAAAPASDQEAFTAVISSALADTHHPRKSVVRAMIHRGGRVISTEGNSKAIWCNAPPRADYYPVTPVPYPDDQED